MCFDVLRMELYSSLEKQEDNVHKGSAVLEVEHAWKKAE